MPPGSVIFFFTNYAVNRSFLETKSQGFLNGCHRQVWAAQNEPPNMRNLDEEAIFRASLIK